MLNKIACKFPWINSEIKSLMKQLRDWYLRKAQHSGSESLWSTYKLLTNQITSFMRSLKKNYYSTLIEENSHDSSKLWKIMKEERQFYKFCNNQWHSDL